HPASPSFPTRRSSDLSPRGFDARGTDDVLFQNSNFLTFLMKDFNSATVGGEWLVGLSDLFDAGLGIGFYQNTAPSVYTNLMNSRSEEHTSELQSLRHL